MASWWFSVLVLVCLQQVFAKDCSWLEGITNCDDCARCGGVWCNILDEFHCSHNSDDWCPSDRERLLLTRSTSVPGLLVEPRHVERSVRVTDSDQIRIHYKHESSNPKIDISLVNTTVKDALQYFKINVETTLCNDGKCTTTISAQPNTEFCPATGTELEFITMRISIDGVAEETTARYHVPCACECSKKVERKSEKCKGNGDFACGACSCYNEWTGETCEERRTATVPLSGVPLPKPDDCDRGDISACNSIKGSICSGNGRCLCDGTCECFADRPGSHYFDEHCADICTVASNCDACLHHPTPGRCFDCYFIMYMENTTRIPEGEEGVWEKCKETTADCVIQYAAMKDDNGEMHVIVTDSCNEVAGEHRASPLNVTVPVVLGVIALVAAAAAVAGYMLWKNKTPPLPLNDPQYQNIDAEDCTGMNPLYKPPTSSFKNPTYGKW